MRKAKNSRMVTMHATVCRPEKATLSKFSGWVEDSYLSVCGARAGDTHTDRHTHKQNCLLLSSLGQWPGLEKITKYEITTATYN